VALLGAMAELGSFSQMLHEDSGAMVARSRTGLCFAVGAEAKFLIEGARKVRQGEWARWFANREELLAAYRREAKADDRILVKGSRSQAMDRVAAELRKGS
jgi:UDP-N-acetylmuramoyl-tripeptide--D-alanyl-D-alanine ligase